MVAVTAAFPFVPADLNSAHFASTYVPADIYKRLLTVCGEKAILVSATDFHSIYASKDGKYIDMELCRQFHLQYLKLFDAMNIHFDHYITTDAGSHQRNVLKAFDRLAEENLIYKAGTEDYVCRECGCHLPERFVKEKEGCCYFCQSNRIEKDKVDHFFMKTKRGRQFADVLSTMVKQKDVSHFLARCAKEDVGDWDFTRHNHFGVAVPGHSEQSVYIWFDSLVGYYSLLEDWKGEIRQVVSFAGKNIVYYHGVIWPMILRDAFGLDFDIEISARGFLNFEKTPDKLIDLRGWTEGFPADYIRFYLAYKVRDNISDYYFSEEDFLRVIDYNCCKEIGGFFYGLWKQLKQGRNSPEHATETGDSGSASEEINLLAETTGEFENNIRNAVGNQQIHETLLALLNHIKLVKRFMNGNFRKTDFESQELTDRGKYYVDREILLYNAALILSILAAYMPKLVYAYSIFEDWVPKDLNEARQYRGHILKENKERVMLNGNRTME